MKGDPVPRSRESAARAKVAEVRAMVEANGWKLEGCTLTLPDEGFRYEVKYIGDATREQVDTTSNPRTSFAMRRR